MSDTKITFTSGGKKLAGAVRVPDGVKPGEKRPAFIVMHGFGSNSSSSCHPQVRAAHLTVALIAVLASTLAGCRHDSQTRPPGKIAIVFKHQPMFGDPAPQIPPAADDARTSGRRRVLAEWIASPRNMLTARVIVNRVWQHHFGRGLVQSG